MAVAHTVDANHTNLVGNLVNHAVVTHADAPVVLAPGQLVRQPDGRGFVASAWIAAMTRP
jgi:hypothetical protein